MAERITLVEEPDRVRLALSPIRRKLLDRLRTPASATQLASELTLGRQRVNYHLRALEAAGLLELVEQRQRRGCVERLLAARAEAFVVDPSVMGGRDASTIRADAQDRFAAGHLIDAAAAIVRNVARMQTRAARQGLRLLVFTLDTEISFATPLELERFVGALGDFVAREAAKSQSADGGRRYRVVVGGHPAPRRAKSSKARSHLETARTSAASEPRDRSGPTKRRARERVGESEGRSPSVEISPPGEHHERVRSRPRRNPRRRAH